jgi:hypothetical protein
LFQRGNAKPAGVTVDQITAALANNPRPHAFVQLEKRGAQSVIVQIAENGPYKTFATADRKSMTLRNGMVTATRGLGGDLMSSDEDALLTLVRAKSTGTAPYVMRYLDGENITQALSLQCTTEPTDPAPVQLGEIDTVGQIVIARCVGDRTRFSNVFIVDDAGRILSARQWLGPFIGFAAVQMLRL